MGKMKTIVARGTLGVVALLLQGSPGFAATAQRLVPDRVRVSPVANSCPRSAAGSAIGEPPALHSAHGALTVAFSFQTRTDQLGRALYCFMTPDGLQNPTLHLVPGDVLTIDVTNNSPRGLNSMTIAPPNCGASSMDGSSVNIHFHGINVSPTCGADEVLKTVINSGETFRYQFRIPANEPPGMYWYHPHVHGMADPMAMGGATGALIVNGIEKLQPAVAELPERTFIIRDQIAAASPHEGPDNCGGRGLGGVPFRDITVNYVPDDSYIGIDKQAVSFFRARLTTKPRQREFWRVANTTADTILDLQLVYDSAPQSLAVVAIDGVPVNSQDGKVPGRPSPVRHFRLPPGSRVEVIVTTPSARTALAQLVTSAIDTGPEGNCAPGRAVFDIATSPRASMALHREPQPLPNGGRRFAGLATAPVNAQRTVFFDENEHAFFMTVEGQASVAFHPDMAPGIVTTAGSVERWTVQNRTRETHVFHIHQIHFLVQSQDNFGAHPPAPGIVGQYLDTIEIPAWAGVGAYPSAALLMDFRGAIPGDFVFHCHILRHEDKGMMNIIRVNAAGAARTPGG